MPGKSHGGEPIKLDMGDLSELPATLTLHQRQSTNFQGKAMHLAPHATHNQINTVNHQHHHPHHRTLCTEDFGASSPRLLLHQQSQAGSAVTTTMSTTNFRSTRHQQALAGGRQVRVRPVTPPIVPAPISTVQDPKHTTFLRWQAKEAVRKHYAQHAEADNNAEHNNKRHGVISNSNLTHEQHQPQRLAPTSPPSVPPPLLAITAAPSSSLPQPQPPSVGTPASVPLPTVDVYAAPREDAATLAVQTGVALPSRSNSSASSSRSSHEGQDNSGRTRGVSASRRRRQGRRTSDEKQLERDKEKRRREALDKIPFVPNVKVEYLERSFYADIRSTVAMSTTRLLRCRSAGMSTHAGVASGRPEGVQQQPQSSRTVPDAQMKTSTTPNDHVTSAPRALPLPRPPSTRSSSARAHPPAAPQPTPAAMSFEFQSTFLDRFHSRPSSASHMPPAMTDASMNSNAVSSMTSAATTPCLPVSPPPDRDPPSQRAALPSSSMQCSVAADPTVEPHVASSGQTQQHHRMIARQPQAFFMTEAALPAFHSPTHASESHHPQHRQQLSPLHEDAMDPWVTALEPFEAKDALLLAFRPGCPVERSKYAPPPARVARLEVLYKTLSCEDGAFLDRVLYRAQNTDVRRRKVHASVRSVTGDMHAHGDDGPFQHQLFKRLMSQDAREFYVNGAVETERWYAERELLSELKSVALEKKLEMPGGGPSRDVPPVASTSSPFGPMVASSSTQPSLTVEGLLTDVRRDIGKQLQSSQIDERSALQRTFAEAFCKKITVDCFGGAGRLTSAALALLDSLKVDVFLCGKPISTQLMQEWIRGIPADALFLHDVISICISLCSGLVMPASAWLTPLREKLQFAVATKTMVPLPDAVDDVGWLLSIKATEWGPRCIQWVCSLGFERLLVEKMSKNQRSARGGGGGEDNDDHVIGVAGGDPSSKLRDAILHHLGAVPRHNFLQAMLPIVDAMAPRTSPSNSVRPNGTTRARPNPQQQLQQFASSQRRSSFIQRRAPSETSSVTSLLATAVPTAATTANGKHAAPPLQPYQPTPPQRLSPGKQRPVTPPDDAPLLLPLVLLSDPLLQTSSAALQRTLNEMSTMSSSTSISLIPANPPPPLVPLSHHNAGQQPAVRGSHHSHQRHNSISHPPPSSVGTGHHGVTSTTASPDSTITPPPPGGGAATAAGRRLSRRQYAALRLPKYAVELLQRHMFAANAQPASGGGGSMVRIERHSSDVY